MTLDYRKEPRTMTAKEPTAVNTVIYPDEIKARARTFYKQATPSETAGSEGVCPECHTIQRTTVRHDEPSYRNRHGVVVRDYLMNWHGPRDNRCDGSRKHPVAWIDIMGLPTWDEMDDLDRGAALMFRWKCHWERDYAYARNNYPVEYVINERLTVLDVVDACRHASIVAGTWDEANDRLGEAEVQRLYDLALNHDRVVTR